MIASRVVYILIMLLTGLRVVRNRLLLGCSHTDYFADWS